jgi:cyclophilin family peptidyl-prolyl cis-trans isomerase
VILNTTVGEIEIELWSKEAPKACRNFVQLCLEGYYDGTIFHRIVKDFIAQGGDPTGTGEGGESIYGAPFKVNLFHVVCFYNNKKRELKRLTNFRMKFIPDYVSIDED